MLIHVTMCGEHRAFTREGENAYFQRNPYPGTNWLSPSASPVPPIKDGFLKMSKEFIRFGLVAVPLLRRLKAQDNI